MGGRGKKLAGSFGCVVRLLVEGEQTYAIARRGVPIARRFRLQGGDRLRHSLAAVAHCNKVRSDESEQDSRNGKSCRLARHCQRPKSESTRRGGEERKGDQYGKTGLDFICRCANPTADVEVTGKLTSSRHKPPLLV